MDIATIVGILIALGGVAGIGMGGKPQDFIDVPSLGIVGMGSIGGLVFAHPLNDIIAMFSKHMLKAFLNTPPNPTELIEKLVGFAETARREGILALESAIDPDEDPFLKNGISLAVDGTEPDLIMDIMQIELQYLEERHKTNQSMWSYWGEAGPAYGMIGTLVGLIIMLRNMSDPSAIGAPMAIALMTTMYGAMLANMFTAPIANKLAKYTAMEILHKRMIIDGIMAIQSGDNPRIVETKLSVFLSPSLRSSGEDGAEE